MLPGDILKHGFVDRFQGHCHKSQYQIILKTILTISETKQETKFNVEFFERRTFVFVILIV